jgi:copper(I)-binding protein
MKMRIMVPAVLALALTAAAVISMGQNSNITAAQMSVTEAWSRATPPGASVGAVYLTIENRGGAADRIVSVESPAASSAMLHETIEQDGVSTMRETEGRIDAGGVLDMKPGGTHIMLMGLNAPLTEGGSVSVTLAFEKAGSMTVEAKIGPIGAEGPME